MARRRETRKNCTQRSFFASFCLPFPGFDSFHRPNNGTWGPFLQLRRSKKKMIFDSADGGKNAGKKYFKVYLISCVNSGFLPSVRLFSSASAKTKKKVNLHKYSLMITNEKRSCRRLSANSVVFWRTDFTYLLFYLRRLHKPFVSHSHYTKSCHNKFVAAKVLIFDICQLDIYLHSNSVITNHSGEVKKVFKSVFRFIREGLVHNVT